MAESLKTWRGRIVLLGSLLAPAVAQAGEKEVKATFLLQGGIGGILIGAGLYAAFVLLAAALFRGRWPVAGLLALSGAFYGYVQYWSFYFLAIALRFLQTRQMRYEFGVLTPLLLCVLVFIGVWGLVFLVLAVRLWKSRWGRPGRL